MAENKLEVEGMETFSTPPADADDLEPVQINVANIDVTAEHVRKFICPDATNADIFMFLGTARSLNLNPVLRQIHLVKYKKSEPGQVVVGYHTYLDRAYPYHQGWSYKFGEDDYDQFCEVTINVTNWIEPFVYKAYKKEIVKGTPIWNSQMRFMWLKTAVSQALRFCIPACSQLPYLLDEVKLMDKAPMHAELPTTPIEVVDVEEVEVPREIRKGYEALTAVKFDNPDQVAQWELNFEQSRDQWDEETYNKAIAMLEELPAEEPEVEEGDKND